MLVSFFMYVNNVNIFKAAACVKRKYRRNQPFSVGQYKGAANSDVVVPAACGWFKASGVGLCRLRWFDGVF